MRRNTRNTRNTLKNGSVRCIVFREKDRWFAVGLEFNIVEEGGSPQEVQILLDEALRGYVEAASKVKLRDAVLNQKADVEYERLWVRLQNERERERIGSRVASFGRHQLAALAIS
ncbi:MAG: hypothetical protein V1856_00340 [Candidatus Liptonbacteria bacterium]